MNLCCFKLYHSSSCSIHQMLVNFSGVKILRDCIDVQGKKGSCCKCSCPS